MGESNIVKKVTDYIEDHLDDDLSLDKIAEELHYSKFYLARVFAEKNGCTIYKYIQGRRLTLAAKELVETEKAITEIAYGAHYGSQQAFTLAFKQLYLCTPQVYRKRGFFYPAQSEFGIQSAQNAFSYAYFVYNVFGVSVLYKAYIDYALIKFNPVCYGLTGYPPAGQIPADYRRGGAIAA